MKKSDFVAIVAKKTGATKSSIDNILNVMGEVILTEVRDNGENILIPSVGNFKQKVNAARDGFNPLTKEKIKIKKSTTVAFKALPSVKK